MPFIYDQAGWPDFTWQEEPIAAPLAHIRDCQGRLIGRMESLGFQFKAEAALHTLTEDVLKSSEIEGEMLDRDQVRSSIARKLGMDVAGLIPSDRQVDGVVEMMIDATRDYAKPLDADRLFSWHAALFPTGRRGMNRITVGGFRDDKSGPMQVVSGPIGRERVHYQAPPAKALGREMQRFLTWFNASQTVDPVLKAAIAHLWFVTVHPFDDGNGRMARAVTDMQLARSEQSAQRFYSMSSQIRLDRTGYYDILEATQKGELDVTPWLQWFLDCLDRAFGRAENALAAVLKKARFWEQHAAAALNTRQRDMLDRLLDGFTGKLTSSKWARLAKCSQDTALRDIDDLIRRGVLAKDSSGGRSTSYSLVEVRTNGKDQDVL